MDSSRYFYLVSVNVFTYILVLGSDGTVKSMTKFGSDGTYPLALAASKLDRIAWNTIVRAGSSSLLAMQNTQKATLNTMIVSFWDSMLDENKCTDFEIVKSLTKDQFKAYQITTAVGKTRAVPATTFTIFDINQVTVDTTS